MSTVMLEGMPYSVIELAEGNPIMFQVVLFKNYTPVLRNLETSPTGRKMGVYYAIVGLGTVVKLSPFTAADLHTLLRQHPLKGLGCTVRLEKVVDHVAKRAHVSVRVTRPKAQPHPATLTQADVDEAFTKSKAANTILSVKHHNPCVCGAHKNKVQPYQVGHADWCDVFHGKKA